MYTHTHTHTHRHTHTDIHIHTHIHTHTHLHTHTHKNPTSEILLREKGVSAMVVYFRLRLSKPVFPKG